MEKCHYCGVEYHPMPRWTNASKLIYVCGITILQLEDGDIEIKNGSPCETLAKDDGYVKRLDLTPRR